MRRVSQACSNALLKLLSPYMDSPLKKSLYSFLKKHPLILSGVKLIHRALRRLQEVTFGTKWTEREWVIRDIGEGYWDGRKHPHRQFLVERVIKLSPGSVLEVGSASGPNLFHLAKLLPCAELVGVDINPSAIKYGNEMFKKEGITNVELLDGKAENHSNLRERVSILCLQMLYSCSSGRIKLKESWPKCFALLARPFCYVSGIALALSD